MEKKFLDLCSEFMFAYMERSGALGNKTAGPSERTKSVKEPMIQCSEEPIRYNQEPLKESS